MEKYSYIFSYFDQKNKGKAYNILYRNHTLIIRNNYVQRIILVNSFNHFKSIVQNDIINRYNTQSTILKYHFNLFAKKCLVSASNKTLFIRSMAIYKKHEMIKSYNEFFNAVITKINCDKIKFNFNLKITFAYFYDGVQEKISEKLSKNKLIFDFKLRFGLISLKKNVKNSIKNKGMTYISDMFYTEKKKRDVLEALKYGHAIRKRIRELFEGKIRAEKIRLRSQINEEKEQLRRIVKLYKNYKLKASVPIKMQFFSNLTLIQNNKRNNAKAYRHYLLNLKQKVYITLSETAIKNKALERHLECSISSDVYEEIRNIINN